MPRRIPFLICCGASFLFGVVLTLWLRPLAFSPAKPAVPPDGANGIAVRTGPWGTLEELEIPLGDSTDLFIDRPARLAKTSWFFENTSKEQLETVLRSCELTPAQWQLLQQPGVVTAGQDGIMITPPDELVWTLQPPARARLYEHLGQTGVNYPQYSPFRFSTNRFAERLAATGLSAEKQARISQLAYTNRGYLCFADLQMLPGILTTNELDVVSEAFYRVPAYRLRLRILPDSDTEALVKYWGQGGREKKIRPLIESFTKISGRTNGASLNISMFLPPTARLRLYTFPTAWENQDAERQDCFWTSLNFFRDPPDPRFLNNKLNQETLATEYHTVQDAPTFGDLVVLLDQAGAGLHACVYVADNIVFTKNGMNKFQPWVLMKMSDMLAFFSAEKPSRMVIFRSNSNNVVAELPKATTSSPAK